MTPRLATAVLLALLGASSAFAAPPQTLNYQGRVKLLGGGPVANSATNTVQVRLCEDAGCGTVAWNDTFTNVSTVDGLFNLVLGSGAPLNIPFDKPYWIGINFNGDGEMTPRSPLTSAPYAFRAGSLQAPAQLSATGTMAVLQAENLGTGEGLAGIANAFNGIGVRAQNNAGGLGLQVQGASLFDNAVSITGSDPSVDMGLLRVFNSAGSGAAFSAHAQNGWGIKSQGARFGVSATATNADGQAYFGAVDSTDAAAEFINNNPLGTPLKVNALRFPSGTGSNGQVLATDGSSQLSWIFPPSVGAPLSLTFGSAAGAPLSVSNHSGVAISATADAATGPAILAYNLSPAGVGIQGHGGTSGIAGSSVSGNGIFGSSSVTNTNFGAVVGSNSAAGTGIGVQGRATGAGAMGVLGTTVAGPPVPGFSTGVYGFSNAGPGYGVLASNPNPGGQALRVSGSAFFQGGTWTALSFSPGYVVNFAGATVTGLSLGVPNPLSLVGSAPYNGAIITASNTGSGHGIAGYATQPGVPTGGPLDFSDQLSAGVFGRTGVSLSAGVMGWSQTSSPETAGVIGMAQAGSGVYGVGVGTGSFGGSFDGNLGTGVEARGVTGVVARGESAGGIALYARGYGPSERALFIENGGSRFNGRIEAYDAPAPNVFALSVGVTGSAQGGAVYGNTGASITAAVRGESTDTTGPAPGVLPGRGVEGVGPVGVYGSTSLANGIGVLSSVNTASTPSIMGFNFGSGVAVQGESTGGVALRGVGGGRGAELMATAPGGVGAYINQSSGARAIESYGNVLFGNGFAASSVTFNTHTHFSGPVTGLSLGVGAPLSLTLNSGSAAPLALYNNSGTALEIVSDGSNRAINIQAGNAPIFYATTTFDAGSAFRLDHFGTSGDGVEIRTLSTTGFGVFANAAGGGTSIGVGGQSPSANGIGVLGRSQANSGNAVGAMGMSPASPVGVGLVGTDSYTPVYPGVKLGVYGYVSGASAVAVYGRNDYGTGLLGRGVVALNADGPIDVQGKAAVANSVAGTGRIYFDQSSNRFRVSENGGSWQDLVAPLGDFVMKAGDTMTGTLNLPSGGLTVGTSQLRVNASGQVGLGTPTPGKLLDLSFGSATTDGLRIRGTTAGSFPAVILQDTAAVDRGYLYYDTSGGRVALHAESAPLTFWVNSAERGRFSTTGDLGLGVTAPGTRLDIAGAFSLRGATSPGIAPVGQGRIYFDSGSNKFLVSESAGNFKDLLVSAPLTLTNTVMNATTIFAANTAAGGGNAIFGLGSPTVAYSGVVGSTSATVPYSASNKASVYGYTDVGSGLGVLGMNSYGDGVGVMGAMGAAVPTAPVGKRIGVFGSSTYWAGDAIGVFGNGGSQGVIGSTSGLPGSLPDSTGVFGYSPVGGGIGVAANGAAVGLSASSSAGNAVFAQSNGSFQPTSYFIQGTNSGTAGSAIAVYGQARNSSAGIGLFGYTASTAPSFPAAGAAVYGYADSANSAAIWGRSTNGGSTRAVVAEGAGIGLSATASAGSGTAIYGAANTTDTTMRLVNNGAGQVLNIAANGAGALEAVYVYQGTSGATPAMYVEADNGTGNGINVVVSGGKGVEASGATVGVQGTRSGAPTPTLPIGGVGVLGVNSTSSGYAGYFKAGGISSRGIVVESSQVGVSAVAEVNGGLGVGVYGAARNSSAAAPAIGVLGESQVSSGPTWGVVGKGDTTGVSGTAYAANGIGVYGSAANLSSGRGGVFYGLTAVSGIGTGVAGLFQGTGVGSRGLVVESTAIGISATSSATTGQPAIYANLNSTSNAIHAINDGTGIGILGQGTGSGIGVQGSLIGPNGGIGVRGLVNSSNSIGVSAANVGATVAGGGAALSVSGLIRVTQSSTSVAPVAATVANISGPNVRVGFSGGGAFSTLTVNNSAATANSAVMLAFNTANQPTGYVVRVAAGVITINMGSALSVSAGEGVNIITINN